MSYVGPTPIELPYWPSPVLALMTLPALMLSERLFWVAVGAALGWHLAYSWLIGQQLLRAWRLR